MKFQSLLELAEQTNNNVGYNEEYKAEFIRLGKKFIKDVVAELKNRGISQIESDYNRGGIAVSGEFTILGLYETGAGGFYIQLSLSSFSSDYGFYRATKGLKDYTGGINRQISSQLLDSANLATQVISRSMMDEAQELTK
jgi:hypothetical protein